MENHKGPVPSWLDESYVTKILSESLKLPELKVKTMDITPGSKVGDNFISQIFRINVVYDSNQGEAKLSLMAKCMVSTRLMATIGAGIPFFEVETAFYKIFAPKIQEITGDDDSITPTVYFIDQENQAIFMEDITVRNFKLQDRNSFLNIDQCYLTIDALATFHGTSYYLLQENPNLKETFKKFFWSSEKNENTDIWFKNAEKSIRKNMPKYGLSEEREQKLLQFFETLKRDNFKVCDVQPGKLNLLQHGDCWKSNMMYHFNGKTADVVKLLDFQIVNYNCFANDLQHFLFSSVETNALVDNLENILQRYYRKLVEVAPDMPGVTFERIKKEFEERYFFGLALSILIRATFLTEEVPDIDDVMNGVEFDMGYGDERFIASLKTFLTFFEKVGAF